MALTPDHAWRLELGGVNAYLVDDGDLTLIDAGMPWHTDAVRQYLADGGYDPRNVDRVLLTHFDLDHVGTLADLGLDCEVYARQPDAGMLAGTVSPPATNHKGLLQRVTLPLVTRPDLPITPIKDGEEVAGFRAYATPGHTPGHTVFVHDAFGVAFVGDLVRESGGELAPSPWAICYDVAENRESIHDVADRIADCEVVAMGHGDPVRTGGGEQFGALADTL
jgi:glyoxylase-like metal-dependent hydrolase (beta-lactamase superfamily II)